MDEVYILGVNGWETRGHDAAAALIKGTRDGNVEIIAAVEEERIIRRKHAYDTLPVQAIKQCISQAGITPDEIAHIVFSWDLPLLHTTRGLRFSYSMDDLLSKLFPQHAFRKKPQLHYIQHHLAHAASAYRVSGKEEAAILIIDGQGEEESTSIWVGGGNTIRPVTSINIGSSLGYMYGSMSSFVGLGGGEPGKAMGLAPYGKSRFLDGILKEFEMTSDGIMAPKWQHIDREKGRNGQLDEQQEVYDGWRRVYRAITGSEPLEKKPYSFREFPQPHLDLCASVQDALEKLILHLAETATRMTEKQHLCYAGGVALNCVANRHILEAGLTESLFVQPAAHDAGTSVGAALEVAAQLGYDAHGLTMNPFLGKAYADAEIKRVLDARHIQYVSKDSLKDAIAYLLASRNIVGVFQGRAEFGPRALGNRSFIADPTRSEIGEYMNGLVKGREEGRPLAGTVIAERAEEYIGEHATPFMTIATQARGQRCPAITHVDGSTRPQVMQRQENQTFYDQIQAFGNATGIYMVMNTSLNFREPMVWSPEDALSLLERTGMHALAFNDHFLVMRDG